MRKQSTEAHPPSRVTWENLESHLHRKAQGWLQDLLEGELNEFLGRAKHQRRKPLDAPLGWRNGYGKPRRLTLLGGTVQLRRPRVRGPLEERFESRLLPLFARRTPEVDALLPELYLHGPALGDFDLPLRRLLGEEASLSSATVGRPKEKWRVEWEAGPGRDFPELEVVYLWVDGVYVKAGREKERVALPVALAALSDRRKEFVAVVPGHRESTQAWGRPTCEEARSALLRLHRELEERNLSAAGSLEEGFEKTLTLHRLGVFALLGGSLRTTNVIEPALSLAGEHCAKANHWANSAQKHRWLAASLLDTGPS